MIIETVIYSVLLISLLFVCDNDYSKKYYVPFKTACSASFLLLLFINTRALDASPSLFGPLALCFVGDVLMGMYNTYKKKRFVLSGLVAFLIAHIFFLAYMINMAPNTSIVVALVPFAMLMVMAVVYKLCHFHMGKIKYPAFLYCYFVSAMCMKSFEIGGIIAIAGLLFFLSDFSIMFLYFFHFKRKTHKKIVHYFNLVTYYFAILLFILGS